LFQLDGRAGSGDGSGSSVTLGKEMRSLCSLSSQRAAARAAAGSRTRQRAAGWLDCWHCAPAPTFGRYYSDAIIDGGDEVDPSRGYEYQRHEIRARRHAALTERSGNLNTTVERSGRDERVCMAGEDRTLCSIYGSIYLSILNVYE
jgi:hypothetical protein